MTNTLYVCRQLARSSWNRGCWRKEVEGSRNHDYLFANGKISHVKDEGVGTVENADRMYYFLQSIDYPAGFRGKQYFSRQSHIHICNHSRRHTFCIYIAGVVHAIAEKLNIKFPGIYDADAYSS